MQVDTKWRDKQGGGWSTMGVVGVGYRALRQWPTPCPTRSLRTIGQCRRKCCLNQSQLWKQRCYPTAVKCKNSRQHTTRLHIMKFESMNWGKLPFIATFPSGWIGLALPPFTQCWWPSCCRFWAEGETRRWARQGMSKPALNQRHLLFNLCTRWGRF